MRLRDDRWSLGAMALSAAFSLAFILAASYRLAGRLAFHLFDDAMISMVYARNLAEGNGLVYNAGEPAVEGITNPLWAFFMALVHVIIPGTRFPALVVSLASAVLLVVAVAQVRQITLRLAPQAIVAARAAAFATALLYPLAYWSLRGMEVGLVTVITLALVDRVLRVDDRQAADGRDLAWLAGLAFVGVWTRLDVAFILGAVTLWALVAMRGPVRTKVVGALVTGTAVGGFSQLAARLAYYGEVLPNTYALKVENIPLATRAHRGLHVVLRQLETGLAPLAVLAAGVVVLANDRRRRSLLAVTVSLVLLAYTVQTGGDAWEWMGYADRFLVPAFVVLLPVAAVTLHALVRGRNRRLPLVIMGSAVAVLLLALIPTDLEVLQTAGRLDKAPGAVAFGLGATVVIALVVLLSRRRPAAVPVIGIAMAAIVTATSMPGFVHLAVDGAHHTSGDDRMANYGLLLGEVLEPEASFAMTWAGHPKYQSMLTVVDLLGKNDPVIAHQDPQPGTFHPGHTKWDYEHSILGLRPDAVARLWLRGGDFIPSLEAAGYVEVVPAPGAIGVHGPLDALWEAAATQRLWVRRDSDRVRWDLLVERTNS